MSLDELYPFYETLISEYVVCLEMRWWGSVSDIQNWSQCELSTLWLWGREIELIVQQITLLGDGILASFYLYDMDMYNERSVKKGNVVWVLWLLEGFFSFLFLRFAFSLSCDRQRRRRRRRKRNADTMRIRCDMIRYDTIQYIEEMEEEQKILDR